MKSSAALCHWLATMPVGRAGALNVRAHNGEVVSWAPRHLKVGRGNGNHGVLTQPRRPQPGLSGTRAGPAENSERAIGAVSPPCRPILGGWNALEPHSNRLPIDNIVAVNVNTFPWRVKWFAAGKSNGSSRESSSLGGAPKALAGRPVARHSANCVCGPRECIYLFVSATHTGSDGFALLPPMLYDFIIEPSSIAAHHNITWSSKDDFLKRLIFLRPAWLKCIQPGSGINDEIAKLCDFKSQARPMGFKTSFKWLRLVNVFLGLSQA